MNNTMTMNEKKPTGSMKAPTKEIMIHFRATEAEKIYYQSLAKANNISMSDLFRKAIAQIATV